MFMDSISAIVLFTPVIAPAAVALGIDPLHLGVVFIVNMEIGYLAPPSPRTSSSPPPSSSAPSGW